MVIVFTINRISYCFVCKQFVPKSSSHFVTREGFSDWRNTIVIDTMLTYLTHRQGIGLRQRLKKQILDECDYWEHILRCLTAVIHMLAEHGLAF